MDVGVNVFTGRSVINADVIQIDSLYGGDQGQRVVDMPTDIRIDKVIFKSLFYSIDAGSNLLVSVRSGGPPPICVDHHHPKCPRFVLTTITRNGLR